MGIGSQGPSRAKFLTTEHKELRSTFLSHFTDNQSPLVVSEILTSQSNTFIVLADYYDIMLLK